MIIFISFLTFVESVCDPSSPTFGNCVNEALEAAGDRIVALESVNNLLIGKITVLQSENIEQNIRLQTVEDQTGLLESKNRVLESSLKALEARLDILEEHSGKGLPVD